MKVKADVLRYELEEDNWKSEDKTAAAEKAYSEAIELCLKDLSQINVVRLTTQMNFSIFQLEVLGEQERALEQASQTLKDAEDYLEKFDLEPCKDSAAVLELIKDNFELWK